MLGDALVDLPRLLVGVDVDNEVAPGGVAADLLEPVARAGADGVGGEADANALAGEVLDPAQIPGRRALAEAVEPAAAVSGVEEDELDSRRVGGLGDREGLLEPEVVELADGGPAVREHLAVHALVALAHARGGLASSELEHRLAPAPEVAASRRAAERSLERVTVRVDEARQGQALRHRPTT